MGGIQLSQTNPNEPIPISGGLQLPPNNPNGDIPVHDPNGNVDQPAPSEATNSLSEVLKRLVATASQVLVSGSGERARAENRNRQTAEAAEAGGGVPILRIPGVNDDPSLPGYDPRAGSFVPVGTVVDEFNLDDLTGIAPVMTAPDRQEVADAIAASYNEGSLNDEDAQLIAQFAESMLGGTQVSQNNGGFDLSAAGGRLAASAFRQRELLTEQAQSAANEEFRERFSVDAYDGYISVQETYLEDIQRHAQNEEELRRTINVFALDPNEHRRIAVDNAANYVLGRSVPSWKKQAAEIYAIIALGLPVGKDSKTGEPLFGAGEFTYAHAEAIIGVSVGSALKELQDNYGMDGADALRELVEVGLLGPEVLYLELAEQDDTYEVLREGRKASNLQQLYVQPLYGSHQAEMLENLQRWLGVTPEGVDSLGFIGPGEYSPEDRRKLRQLILENATEKVSGVADEQGDD